MDASQDSHSKPRKRVSKSTDDRRRFNSIVSFKNCLTSCEDPYFYFTHALDEFKPHESAIADVGWILMTFVTRLENVIKSL